MPKRRSKRYKFHRSDHVRLSRQLNNQLAYRQEELAREETLPEYVAEEKKDHPIRVADWSYLVRIVLFFLVLFISAVMVWVCNHPTHSEKEGRDLKTVPKFKIGEFFSGKYFQGVDLWFSDTFPGRDKYISLSGWTKQFQHMSDTKVYHSEKTVEEKKEAPAVAEERPTMPPTASEPTATRPAAKPTTTGEKWENGDTDAPTQTLGGILVQGNSAFEFYNFSEETANEYIDCINRAASLLNGKATVYDMVVPTSIGVMLPESIRNELNSSDQKKAIDYLYGKMYAEVKDVPILDTLISHNVEYLYFHSDHHWTALGAYYAYVEFANAAGLTPHDLGEYPKRTFDGFQGSFFKDTQDAKLKVDTVYAYEPIGGGELWFGDDENTKELDWNIISDVSGWAADSKYNTFIGGDNAYTEITSGSVHDGSSIVVVKESFGNAFVPFLVDHYEKVYVLDYRYYTAQTLSSFVDAKGAKTVLFINNMSATRNAGLVDAIARLVG